MVYLTSPTQKLHLFSGISKIQVMNARTVQALRVEHSLVSMYAAWVEPLGHSCWQISLTHGLIQQVTISNGKIGPFQWENDCQTQIEVGQNL